MQDNKLPKGKECIASENPLEETTTYHIRGLDLGIIENNDNFSVTSSSGANMKTTQQVTKPGVWSFFNFVICQIVSQCTRYLLREHKSFHQFVLREFSDRQLFW